MKFFLEMYDRNYICCYHNTDLFTEEEEQILTDYDKMFVRDALYRQDLLNIFCLESFDDELVLLSVKQIFELVKKEKIIQRLIEIGDYDDDDELLLKFMLLFSFDNLYKSHPLLLGTCS